MERKHYCKRCGSHAVELHYEEGYYCNVCNKLLQKDEYIPYWTYDARVAQIKAMHTIMCNTNDEEIYYNGWIYHMPDGATEGDIIDIALDDEAYNDCFDAFARLIQDTGNRW